MFSSSILFVPCKRVTQQTNTQNIFGFTSFYEEHLALCQSCQRLDELCSMGKAQCDMGGKTRFVREVGKLGQARERLKTGCPDRLASCAPGDSWEAGGESVVFGCGPGAIILRQVAAGGDR